MPFGALIEAIPCTVFSFRLLRTGGGAVMATGEFQGCVNIRHKE